MDLEKIAELVQEDADQGSGSKEPGAPPTTDTMPENQQVVNLEPEGSVHATNLDAVSGETVAPTTEALPNNQQVDEDKEDEEGVECGFLVDRINSIPYRKAIERGEVPFCAFAPISTHEFYLLRIQDCSDTTRHMLVPASKEEVFRIPGALKITDGVQESGNDEAINCRVAVVGVARQIYSEEEKQLVVSVDSLLRKDKKKIASVNYLTPDKFADFAFLGFDGNISEFANKPDSIIKDNRRPSTNQNHHQQTIKSSYSPPPVPRRCKSPPKAPTRRGRGGRRKQGRKSPSMPSSRRGHSMFHPPSASEQPSSQMYSGGLQPFHSGTFQSGTVSNEHTIFVKLDENGQAQQFVTQIPVSQYQDSFTVPLQFPPMMKSNHLQVPIPVNEVTVSTTEERETPETSHDIITIAFDQLVNMTNSSFNINSCTEPLQMGRGACSSRGGRRPGRKPGRKPMKQKLQDIDENTTFGQLSIMSEAGVSGPKRRGRPPKNRLAVPIANQENDNTNVAVEDELEKYDKRVKLQISE